MSKELDRINEIDRKLDEIVKYFERHFRGKVRSQIRREINFFLDELDFTDRGAAERLKRHRAINRFRIELARKLGNGSLNEGQEEVIAAYKELVAIANQYFSILSSSYDKKLYTELYKDSLEILKTALSGQGFSTDLAGKVTAKLAEWNMQGVSKTALKREVSEYLAANNELTRYADQVASDTLYTMTRIYQNRIAEDLSVEYWLYAGTLISTSRSFCKSKTGRAFKTEEVKAWAAQKWSGKIADTNEKNIFERLGGYGCRHTLRPISKAVYENFTKGNESN